MGFLKHKRILITGLLSNRSIAYGVAAACHRQQAELAFSYQSDRFCQRVQSMAQEFGSSIVIPCDVAKEEDSYRLFEQLKKEWGNIDGFLHSIAYAPKESISGDFLAGCSRESFRVAHDISSYSFCALAKAAVDTMDVRDASFVTMTYLGSTRAVTNYNTMGLAKASLEAAVRYMACSVGERHIRVNAISSGPIKTLAASGIPGFSKMLKLQEVSSPLKKNVTIEEVGDVAAFLFSPLSSGITGEIIRVDAGFSISGFSVMPNQ